MSGRLQGAFIAKIFCLCKTNRLLQNIVYFGDLAANCKVGEFSLDFIGFTDDNNQNSQRFVVSLRHMTVNTLLIK